MFLAVSVSSDIIENIIISYILHDVIGKVVNILTTEN